MNHNWQQPPERNHQAESQTPPRTGGLLSSYTNKQASPTQPAAPNQGGGQFQPRIPTSGLKPLSPTLGRLGAGHGLLANTRRMMHQWSDKVATISGKMAAMAGQTYQPPSPPLELYHPTRTVDAREMPREQQRTRWKRSRAQRVTRLMRMRRERWRRTAPGGGNLLSKLLIALVVVLVVGGGSGGAYGYAYYQSQLPQLQGLAQYHIPQTTRIYDRNGVLLWTAYDQYRTTPIAYKDVPQVMVDAMTSAEDPTFFHNEGIDLQGILRAGVSYVQHSGVAGGGSTITQQVIKNLLEGGPNAPANFNRKLPEAALAIGLTQQYPKWKILEMYFNIAGFGAQDQGVEAAAQDYFGLQPQCDQNYNCKPGIAQLELNAQGQRDPMLGLARASLLAGMPQDPVGYDPTKGDANRQAALARQQYVLERMIAEGIVVDGKQMNEAMAQQAEVLTAKMTFTPFQRNKICPHFVDWVINKVETALGHGDPNAGIIPFLTGGFNIRTTIDSNLEKYVEDAVTRHLTQPELQAFGYGYHTLNTDNNVNDAAVLVLNAKTGEILAMDGSANYNDTTNPKIDGQFNVVDPPPTGNGTARGRPPGSTFKPIEYVTAFEKGWYPGMALPDYKTYFPNGTPAGTPSTSKALYTPPDFSSSGNPDFHWNKTFSIRTGTGNSFNVTALKALTYAGTDDVMATAQRLGISPTTGDGKPWLGTAWGIGSENVPLIQMVGAYQTFANQGQRIPPQGILDIWDNYGHNLYHYDPTHPPAVQVLTPQVSYLMTSVLMDNSARQIDFGGNYDLTFNNQNASCGYNPDCPLQVAAKTGTTDNYADNLTIGYTPGVVVGVWAGNANDEPMDHVTGITGAGPIWRSVIEFASHGWCNTATDKVPCPNVDRTKLGVDETPIFPIPGGIHRVSVSSVDGLQGGGNYDWMIDGQAPLQAGYVPPAPPANNNGNNNNNNGNNGG